MGLSFPCLFLSTGTVTPSLERCSRILPTVLRILRSFPDVSTFCHFEKPLKPKGWSFTAISYVLPLKSPRNLRTAMASWDFPGYLPPVLNPVWWPVRSHLLAHGIWKPLTLSLEVSRRIVSSFSVQMPQPGSFTSSSEKRSLPKVSTAQVGLAALLGQHKVASRQSMTLWPGGGRVSGPCLSILAEEGDPRQGQQSSHINYAQGTFPTGALDHFPCVWLSCR